VKRIITALLLVAATSVAAQSLDIKLFDVANSKTKEGSIITNPGRELSTFAVPEGAHAVRMFIQVPVTNVAKVAVKDKLHLKVVATGKAPEYNIHDWFWATQTKPTTLSTDAQFPAGSYSIFLVDKDRPDVVFAKRDIVVSANAAKVANVTAGAGDFPYNRSKFKIWTTKSIDDNWKPVGPVSRIKAGTCITLFFDSQDKIKNLGSMRWGIFKLDATGREVYVNQKDQGIGQLAEWRRLSYEECDEFRTPGTYRIYISSKDDADVHSGVNNKNYFAKADLVVE
jgi:hypothetical protein